MAVIKPLSIKLQKCTNDVVKEYGMVTEVRRELDEVRETVEDSFHRIYEQCAQMAEHVGVEPSVPRTNGRQAHRSNQPHSTPEEYYRRSLYIPFLDHTCQEIGSRFGLL